MLYEAIIYLSAAVLAVVLSRKLGFGSVLGYLLAGVVIGPWGLRFVTDTEQILHFSEFGVVLLLFIIGLELQPSRLWVMRRAVFGLGLAQVLVTGCVLTMAAIWLVDDWRAATLIGFGLSLSSTAFVLQMLAERKELPTVHGRAAFGVLLFQDLAVIPLIALVPLLASETMAPAVGLPLWDIAEAVLVIVGFVIGGRYLLRPVFRLVASAQIHEIFAAAALLLVIGSAFLMESLGLSRALGAFMAGMLVADSEYRHQLETDIEPFKGLLLGLFFMAVGMSANLGLLLSEPLIIGGLTLALVLIKSLILFPLARSFGHAKNCAMRLSAILAQGGEFAFVLFTLGVLEGVLTSDMTSRLILVVTLSMAATPLLYLANEKIVSAMTSTVEKRPFDTMDDTDNPVVIAGFGRFGQIIGRILAMRKIPFTALEANPEQVDFVRRYGNKVYFGDAARLDLLRSAHVERCKVFVVAIDDITHSMKIAGLVKQHFPNVTLIARARNRQHAFALMDIGAKVIVRDTLLSSIFTAGEVLKAIGFSRADADAAMEFFRVHDEEALEKQYAVHRDEEALLQSSRDAAEELRRLFEADAKA